MSTSQEKYQFTTIWDGNKPSATPLEEARKYAHFKVADTETLEEVRDHIAHGLPKGLAIHERGLLAIEQIAHEEVPAGTLVQVVGWDVGWVLDEETDDEARTWLLEFAEFVRATLGDLAPPRQYSAPPAGPRRFFYPEA